MTAKEKREQMAEIHGVLRMIDGWWEDYQEVKAGEGQAVKDGVTLEKLEDRMARYANRARLLLKEIR